MRIVIILVLGIVLFSSIGCTTTQKGAVIGAMGGAAAGAAIGYFGNENSTDDAVKGAGIGAVTGAIVGAIIGYFAEE